MKLTIKYIIIFIFLFFFSLEVLFEKIRINSVSFHPQDIERKKIANKSNIKFDNRSKVQVIKDFRNNGIDVYSNIGPEFFTSHFKDGFLINDKNVFPLGGKSNTFFLMDNEAGYFPLYKTDKFGFSNVKLENSYKDIEVIITGDHIAEGLSVNPENTVSSIMTENGCKTFNVGRYDNAALAKYASLVEYGNFIKPKVIIWLHYPDDIHEINRELSSPILSNYLNIKNYSQNLREYQEQIDLAFVPFLEMKFNQLDKIQKFSFSKIIKLGNIRDRLSVIKNSIFNKKINQFTKDNNKENIYQNLKNFNNIMSKTNKLAIKWNSKKYFLYFPEFNVYGDNEEYNFRGISINKLKKEVKKIVKKNGFEFYDFQKIIFDNHNDPLSLFPMRINSHYSSEGYNLIAKKILSIIQNEYC